MKRITKNRIEIMQHLTQGHPDCGLPPYSVSSIHYMIYGLDWTDQATNTTEATQRAQRGGIRRTLSDLLKDGLVTVSRELCTDREGLPYWENVYQITAMLKQNEFDRELDSIEGTISRAYNGFGTLFGGKPDGEGLPADEIATLTKRVKSIIQQSHPDKGGNVQHFKTMKQCLDRLRKMPVKNAHARA